MNTNKVVDDPSKPAGTCHSGTCMQQATHRLDWDTWANLTCDEHTASWRPVTSPDGTPVKVTPLFRCACCIADADPEGEREADRWTPVAEQNTKQTTAIELLDPLRPCPRCNGTGIYRTRRGPDTCYRCNGTAEVPSVRDQRRIDAANRVCYRLIKAMRVRAEERDGRRNGRIEFESHQGFGLLEENERHRLPALFQSLEAGRVDEVIDMLIAYRNAHIAKASA
jgi:hypothetical protein